MFSFEPGKTVLFYHQEVLCTGLILAVEENRCQILDTSGNTFSLPSGRIVLISAEAYSPISLETLNTFVAQYESLISSFTAIAIEENLAELPEPFSFEQACQSMDLKSDQQRFAFFVALRNQPERYVWKKGSILLRSDEEYRQIVAEKQAQAERNAYLQEVGRWLADLKRTGSSTLPKNVKQCLLRELRDLQLHGEPRDLAKLLRDNAENQSPESQIHALRLLFGDLKPESDPIASAAGIPIAFETDLWQSALISEPMAALDIGAFSIDAEDTDDHDDAISLQTSEGGYRLGIHISDVAARIPLQSALYEECRQRVSSLYLAAESVPLLPPELSTQAFSLNEGSIRPVISLYVELDHDLKIAGWQFIREDLRIAANLHYKQVDKQLREQPFSQLMQIARTLKNERLGAEPERKAPYSWYLKVLDSEIVMQRVNNLSPARFIVEELMVLYNRLFAEYALKHGLPLIFRNVSQWLEEEDDPESQVLGSQAYLSTRAQFHPGIGTSAYLHATSPIRRYTDIVNQYQMDALLSDSVPAFQTDQLDELIPQIEKRLLLLREIAHRSERYWLLRFLGDKQLYTPLNAVLVRRLRQVYIAELTQWEKRIALRCEDRPPLHTELKVIINQVHFDDLTASADVIL